MERINCHKCRFHYITYEPATPYGCRAYGFKSKIAPSQAVFQSSGSPCSMFQPKESGRKSGSE